MQKTLAASDSISFFRKAIAVTSAIALVSGNLVVPAYARGHHITADKNTLAETVNARNLDHASHSDHANRLDRANHQGRNGHDVSVSADKIRNFAHADSPGITVSRVVDKGVADRINLHRAPGAHDRVDRINPVKDVDIDLTGKGKINLEPGPAFDRSAINKAGRITIDTGRIAINKQQARDIAASVINLKGMRDTDCLSCRPETRISTATRIAIESKNINFQGRNPASTGNRINITTANSQGNHVITPPTTNHHHHPSPPPCPPHPTPIPTPIPTPVPTPIPTPVPTPIPTPVPTPIPTPVPTPIPTPVPTPIPTPVPTPTPTPIPTSDSKDCLLHGDCTEIRPLPLVHLPNPLAALEPAAGPSGNFCNDVNVSGLPGLCSPDKAPSFAELDPGAGEPAPVKYVSPFKVGPSKANKKASSFAELSPAAGEKCTKVKGDVVCIKDEIDK